MVEQKANEKCHFIGIGGIGMSGLARILLSTNCEVSGSDIATTYVTEGLAKNGAKIFNGQAAENISPQMTVIYSSDIKKENPEYQAALNMKCKMLHRSDLLLQLMKPYKTLSIAGTHGKTTTSSLLAYTLSEAGLEPSFAVGGMIPQYQSNAGHGKGEYFVAEADESDGTFLKYDSYGAIVTNIDFDHMDHYKTEQNLVEAFKTFFDKVASSQHLFWCGDDFRLAGLKLPGISYGFGPQCQLRLSHFRQEGWKVIYDIDFQGKHYSQVEVALTGMHNALNSAAVFGLALICGAKEKAIRAAFQSFKGIMRRCEKKGEVRDVLLLDDYAHHPTEIRATLHAIRLAVEERRIIALFQPHRYSRTKLCLGTYGSIFDEVDELIITDIFSAGEKPIDGLSHENVLAEIAEASPTLPIRYIPRAEIAQTLSKEILPHDVVVGLGAGDITKISGEFLAIWKKKPPRKMQVAVLFGGRSAEHEVSVKSARYISNSLNKDLYDVHTIGISKDGYWVDNANPHEIGVVTAKETNKGYLSTKMMEKVMNCDVFFPVLHGPYGEDGTLQGFFEVLRKPYVGCDFRASALCMDKAMTKRIMLDHSIATVPFVDFTRSEWRHEKSKIFDAIAAKLSYPLFVKPSHLGSTVGVSKVRNLAELEKAIDHAFTLDTHILVETGLEGIREIEFATMGNDRVVVLPPGECPTQGSINHYTDKYGAKALTLITKVDLPQDKIHEGMKLAAAAYRAAGCTGLSRLDFFYDKQNKYWFNEINPLPGCTATSMFPQLCEANGIMGPTMTSKMIILALQKKRFCDKVIIPTPKDAP